MKLFLLASLALVAVSFLSTIGAQPVGEPVDSKEPETDSELEELESENAPAEPTIVF